MTDDQIQHMVTRFLAWSLPENFSPDGGVSFSRLGVNGFTYPMPVGTNLLDHEQATAMVRYITSGATDDATVQALTERLENERAAGWRDAVSCVQYCVANWHQDRARRTGEGEALIAAGEELVDELVNGEPSDWLGTEWKSAQKWMAELNALTVERDAALERVKALEAGSMVSLADARRAVDACGGTHPPGQEEYGKGYDAALTEADAALVRLGRECVR
jgi:hypothetical protein